MKITSINIKDYLQFKDLKLKLTYPLGHKKEEQPLDKICIIGQSGTGKTNILKAIKYSENSENIKIKLTQNKISSYEEIYLFLAERNCFSIKEKKIKVSRDDKMILDELEEWLSHGTNHSSEKYLLSASINAIKNQYLNEEPLENKYISHKNSWSILKNRIDNYEKEKTKYTKKLFNRMMHDTKYSKEDSIADMRKWEAKNENILEKIADDINSIIKKFNLELKIDEDTNSYEELIIKDLSNGNIIKYDDVSTGTKNLLSTFIPLKSYNPKDSIILIDEPENSFYPDIQRELTDLYMNVGENNQLIMATHSPLIASSFEPWEVVELKFDENNQIYRELYYEGENHINNYFLNPQLLTWTNILTQIFDLKEKSNSDIRKDKLIEYATLKAQIKAIDSQDEKIEKAKELHKLSKLLGLGNNETNI